MVSLDDFHLAVFTWPSGSARTWLALAAGGQEDYFMGRQVVDLIQVHQDAVGVLQIPQPTAMLTTLTMLWPLTATLRSCLIAALITC